MDTTIENLIDLLENAIYIPSDKKEEVLSKLSELSEDSEVPSDLKGLIEELLELEANKAAESADDAEDEIKAVDEEIKSLEDEQAERIQSDLKEDTEAMNKVFEEYSQEVNEFEANFEKEIEGEVAKGEENQADDIRKKLGIS